MCVVRLMDQLLSVVVCVVQVGPPSRCVTVVCLVDCYVCLFLLTYLRNIGCHVAGRQQVVGVV